MQDGHSISASSDSEGKTRDRLLPISEVCRTAGRGKTWIMEAHRSGIFPAPAKISGRLFWSECEVQEWIADRLSERFNGRDDAMEEGLQ